MAAASARQQIERLLDEEPGRTVPVIMQASEDDRAVRAAASAAAAALEQRRLLGRPSAVTDDLERVLRAGRGKRPNRTPSMAAAGAGTPVPTLTRAAATAALRPVLGTDAVRRALARAGENPAASAVTPLLAARSVAATLTRDELAALRDAPGAVAAVHRNRHLDVPPVIEVDGLPVGTRTAASAWGVERVSALAAWGAYGARGKGVKVAVLDTGVDAEHPDLRGKVANWAEFDANGRRVTGSAPHDSDRHGTHVCGTIAGGNTSGRWIGVAPDVRLAVGLVLDGANGGSDAQVLAGIDWAIDRCVDLINLSLGALVIGPETPGTYTRALLDCFLRGVAVVAAVGNEGDGTSGSPGNDLFALSAGAVDVDDVVAGFSGGRTQILTESTVIRPELLPLPYPKPDVGAPGVAIESSVPGGGWAMLSGTSMAAPHISGAMAVLLSATGGLAAGEGRDPVGALVGLMGGGVRGTRGAGAGPPERLWG